MNKEGKITENIITKNGKTHYESITQITTYWNNINPYYRKGILLYGISTIGICICYNYIDGKNALFKIRQEHPLASNAQEWKAVRDGINGFENFWEALFFPYTAFSKIMPSVVLALNPKVK